MFGNLYEKFKLDTSNGTLQVYLEVVNESTPILYFHLYLNKEPLKSWSVEDPKYQLTTKSIDGILYDLIYDTWKEDIKNYLIKV
jgi:hypothetical protein